MRHFSEPEIKTRKHTRGVKQPAAVRSIVNPSSKRYRELSQVDCVLLFSHRRKAASGVVFGEDETND